MTFSYYRNIYLSDTDAAGVLYFAQGMSICHEAYEEWLNAQGVSIQTILKEKKFALPIIHGEIDFFSPIFCGYRLQIDVKCVPIKDREYAIAYQVFSTSSPDKLLAKALTKHVCINPITRKRVPLPREILGE
ncbi:acyl-CoA thioesterase [Hyella patelloides]|nr:thioesterase family protein [Hyella patelloides]